MHAVTDNPSAPPLVIPDADPMVGRRYVHLETGETLEVGACARDGDGVVVLKPLVDEEARKHPKTCTLIWTINKFMEHFVREDKHGQLGLL